jgi:hypothetical protein
MDLQTYVEGRDGSEFEIEFVNNNAHDVEAILSVDGLSVTDGKPAGSDSTGYMVPARGRVRIPGWTLDSKQVANFFFAGAKGGSYAEQSGQDDRKTRASSARRSSRASTCGRTTTGPNTALSVASRARACRLAQRLAAASLTTSGDMPFYNSVSDSEQLCRSGWWRDRRA